jgi:hypothetical protein
MQGFIELQRFPDVVAALALVRPLNKLVRQVFPEDDLFDHVDISNDGERVVVYCSHELARCAVNAEVTL